MKRNPGLDLLKAVCSFLIVCIHVPFAGIMGTATVPLARIAVPIFFMITGYYYSHTKSRGKETQQIRKIFRLFAGANLLYFFWFFLRAFLTGDSIPELLDNLLSLKTALHFIVLNESPFEGHLWYLGAILYVLLIVFVFEKKWSRQKLYPLIPLLLLTDLVFGKYSLLLLGRSVPYVWVRNFLFVGLPYFLIGDLLNTRGITVKPRTALLLSLVFAATTLLERSFLGFYHVNAERDHYISTTFLAISVFLLAEQFEGSDRRNWHAPLCHIGAKLSSAIYLLHPIFVTAMAKIVSILSRHIALDILYGYIGPFVIFLISVIAARIWLTAIRKLQGKLCRVT